MRRIGIVAVLILLLFIPLSVSSITQDFTVFKEGFSDFASSMAAELPFNTVVGLTWSDAYIGKLPHFGLGVTLGATLIPFDIFNKATQTLGVDLASEFSELANWGFPLPAATVEARVGGIYLPFDLGFKVGYLPEEAKIILPKRMGLDYLLIGGDFRFALVEDKGFLPDISIGVGFNYLKGSVAMKGILGGNQEIANVGPYNIELQDPDLYFDWEARVYDFKIQLSKSLILFTPFFGFGASYGVSSAGGGLSTDVLVGGVPITDAQIQEIMDYYALLGEDGPDNLNEKGIFISSSSEGWMFRAFGGFSLNLFVLKVDINLLYNFTNKTLGASINGRFQF